MAPPPQRRSGVRSYAAAAGADAAPAYHRAHMPYPRLSYSSGDRTLTMEQLQQSGPCLPVPLPCLLPL